MSGLGSLLGYDEIASSIAMAMDAGAGIDVIQGPPGAGKSWLAKGIGSIWEESGGSTLVAEGERLQGDAAFYPLNLALARLSSGWQSVGSDLAQISSAGERMVGTAGVITATVQAVTQMRPSRRHARKLYLGSAEQKVLFDLERLAKGRPLLLIADNLHWWDSESLKLLDRLRKPAMGEAFPFLAEMRLVAVQTVEPYQSTSNREARDALLESGATRLYALHRPPRDLFRDVLVALDAPVGGSDTAIENAFDLTGGHLALAARCAKRLRDDGEDFLLTASDQDEFVQELLTDRVRSLGSVGASALALLQIAAVLGLRFRRTEVACAFNGGAAEVSKLLRDCRDEALIELSDDVGRFVHDLFRQHFLGSDGIDRTAIHESIADCLRILRPGEYVLRCRHARKAERKREAAALGVQAALERQREGLPWRALPEDVLAAIEDADMMPVAETFEEAVGHLNENRSSNCLEVLNRLPRKLPRSLAAEADYTRATCLTSTRSEDDRETGRAILEAWSGFESEEPELGIRLMNLRLFILTLQVDKAPGRALEGEIRQALIDRADFDQAAEDVSYTLDRCAGSLHEPEVCLARTREAMCHFAPPAGQTLIRRPVEYYRCMVNLAATCLTNAKYTEARAIYEELDALVSDYAVGTFPRLDYPHTNALLVDYRLGLIDVETAITLQREIVAEHNVPDDPFYPENALAVYLALADSGDEALQILNRLDDQLGRRHRPAPSMLYLIRANRCVTRYVNGDIKTAAAEWTGLTDVCERIPYLIGRYLVSRHELLGVVMQNGASLSPVEFDECLLDEERFGRLWDQLGRGFRMPEIEWWH